MSESQLDGLEGTADLHMANNKCKSYAVDVANVDTIDAFRSAYGETINPVGDQSDWVMPEIYRV